MTSLLAVALGAALPGPLLAPTFTAAALLAADPTALLAADPATPLAADPAIPPLAFPAREPIARDTVEASGDTTALYRAEEIAVTVTRTTGRLLRLPYAVTLLGPEEFQEGERGISLEEALRAVPGALVQDRRNFALGDRIVVRGAGARAQFGVRGVRVLVDGIPLTMPDGQSTLDNLDLVSLGSAEILRGPSSALYGNASGGVLAFRTEPAPATPLSVRPRILAGSHGLLDTRATAAGRAGGVEYVAAGGRSETEGFRAHSRAEHYRAGLVATGSPGGGATLQGVFSFFHAPFAENPGSLGLEDARERPRFVRPFLISQGTGKSTTQGQAGLSARIPLAGQAELQAAVWGVRRDIWNPIPDRIIDLDRGAGGGRVELRGRTAAAAIPLRWTGGLDLEVQRDLRAERENLGAPAEGGRAVEGDLLLDQRERVLGLGPFLQLEAELDSRWTLTLAGRFDLYDFSARDFFLADGDDSGRRSMSSLSPMAGIAFAPREGLSLYASFATAFQTPTANELSNRPDGAGGFNPELEPERVESLEAGIKGALREGGLRFELAGYRSRVKDALIPFQGETEEVFFRNAGRSDRAGLEAALAWRPLPALRASVAYTFQRFRFSEFVTEEGDFSGNREPGGPDHALFVGLVGRGPAGLRTELNVRWTDAYPVDDANRDWNWSYRVVDLRLSLDRPGGLPLRPFLGIDNLFDERYNGSVVPNAFGRRYYEPAPGTEVYGGLSLPLGAAAPGR